MSNNNIVVISDKAADEIKKVVNWCGKIAIDLKSRFIEELDYFFSRISNIPYAYKVVDKDVHRCLMKIFPYIIFFSINQNEIIVLRIRHKKQKQLKRYR